MIRLAVLIFALHISSSASMASAQDRCKTNVFVRALELRAVQAKAEVQACQDHEQRIYDQNPWSYTHSSSYRPATKQCSDDWAVYAVCDEVRADACQARSDVSQAISNCQLFFRNPEDGLSVEAVSILNNLRSSRGGANRLSKELTGQAIDATGSIVGSAIQELDNTTGEGDKFWEGTGSSSGSVQGGGRTPGSCLNYCVANGNFVSTQNPRAVCSDCCRLAKSQGRGSCGGWRP